MSAPQCSPQVYISIQPTNAPYANAAADAEALYKSMKGIGTDDKVLSNIVATRSRDQLQQIKKAFESKYSKTLASFIKGDTSGQYEELLIALVDDKHDYDAFLVNHAIKGLGTNDEELIEVLCTRNNVDIIGMKQSYQKLYKQEMEKDVVGDTSGDYRDLLVSLLKANRNEASPPNVEEAKKDAQALYNAGEGKIGTNEKVFIDILSTRSFPQLYTINQCYSQLTQHSLEHGIAKETSFNFKKALITLLTPREEYFATQILVSIKGTGTDDHKLIRNISYLSTYPMLFKAVNAYYMHKNKHNIANDVGGDTSGWYKKTAEAVITNRVNL